MYVCEYIPLIPLWGWTPEKESITSTWWTMSAGHIGPTGPPRLPPNPPRLPLLPIHHQFNIAIDENPFVVDVPLFCPLNMVIFCSYVGLPEGILFAMVPLQSLFKHRVPGSSQLGGIVNLPVCCFPAPSTTVHLNWRRTEHKYLRRKICYYSCI